MIFTRGQGSHCVSGVVWARGGTRLFLPFLGLSFNSRQARRVLRHPVVDERHVLVGV